jgi:hypothetical protein
MERQVLMQEWVPRELLEADDPQGLCHPSQWRRKGDNETDGES